MCKYYETTRYPGCGHEYTVMALSEPLRQLYSECHALIVNGTTHRGSCNVYEAAPGTFYLVPPEDVDRFPDDLMLDTFGVVCSPCSERRNNVTNRWEAHLDLLVDVDQRYQDGLYAPGRAGAGFARLFAGFSGLADGDENELVRMHSVVFSEDLILNVTRTHMWEYLYLFQDMLIAYTILGRPLREWSDARNDFHLSVQDEIEIASVMRELDRARRVDA